jgi:ketosteroid isomerase-like protein
MLKKMKAYCLGGCTLLMAIGLNTELSASEQTLEREIKAHLLEIQELNDRQEVEAITANHSADAVVLLGGDLVIRGHEEIANFYTALFQEGEYLEAPSPTRKMEFDTLTVGGEGDIAYYAGKFIETVSSGKESTVTQGQFLAVFKRVDGKWMLIADMSAVAE